MVCEPTGNVERKVFETARRLGHQTAYVNSEHVAKLYAGESGDTGKTDASVARVINLVARLDRTQTVRLLEGEYQLLRQLGRITMISSVWRRLPAAGSSRPSASSSAITTRTRSLSS